MSRVLPPLDHHGEPTLNVVVLKRHLARTRGHRSHCSPVALFATTLAGTCLPASSPQHIKKKTPCNNTWWRPPRRPFRMRGPRSHRGYTRIFLSLGFALLGHRGSTRISTRLAKLFASDHHGEPALSVVVLKRPPARTLGHHSHRSPVAHLATTNQKTTLQRNVVDGN